MNIRNTVLRKHVVHHRSQSVNILLYIKLLPSLLLYSREGLFMPEFGIEYPLNFIGK